MLQQVNIFTILGDAKIDTLMKRESMLNTNNIKILLSKFRESLEFKLTPPAMT